MRQKFTETEIRKMYEEEYIKKNLSMKKVGEKYNMSEGQVAYYFKKFNLKTKDLSVVHRKYTLDESYFEKIDREDKAYWLGFLYADGNVYINEKNRKQYVITLSLKNTDREHVVDGQTIPEVYALDPSYIKWAKENMEKEPAKSLLKNFP